MNVSKEIKARSSHTHCVRLWSPTCGHRLMITGLWTPMSVTHVFPAKWDCNGQVCPL